MSKKTAKVQVPKTKQYAVTVVVTGRVTVMVDATSASHAEILAAAAPGIPDFDQMLAFEATAKRA